MIDFISEDGTEWSASRESVIDAMDNGTLEIVDGTVWDMLGDDVMEAQVFFKDREVAIETLWWMMTQGDRYKVDKVKVIDATLRLEDMDDDECLGDYAYIDYRYFREDDDLTVQEYARHIRETVEKNNERWDVINPDQQNLEMLDVLRAFIEIDNSWQAGYITNYTREFLLAQLDDQVATTCSFPPGPRGELIKCFAKMMEDGFVDTKVGYDE